MNNEKCGDTELFKCGGEVMSYEVVELYQGFESYVLECGSIEKKKQKRL